MIHLDLDDLLHIARRTLGEFQVRDIGLLESAAARPRATAFGEDAYPTVHDKAAALLHSLATTAPLVQGNRPFALAATLAFLALNGRPLAIPDQQAVDLVTRIVTGRLEDVRDIAAALEG